MSELNWIKHDGGPMPVPGDTIVEVLLRCETFNNFESDHREADEWDWTHSNNATYEYDITHYAIVGDVVADDVAAPIDEISGTLAERGNRYGSFDGHAKITQAIKRSYYDSPNWLILPPDMKEALDMIAHKIGRILNGDPNYRDSWIDMVGYAKLISDRLED